jgi:hypothetical protein
MGKQVNFYMNEDDEHAFFNFLRSTGELRIFSYTSNSATPNELFELPSRETLFWACQFLQNASTSSDPIMKFIKTQSYYIPDVAESELIEFSRSFVDEGRLVRGRIWAEMNRYDSSIIVRKPQNFLKWYERIASWIKRNSTRNSCGDYILPGAAKFAAEGGHLCQAVMSNGGAI